MKTKKLWRLVRDYADAVSQTEHQWEALAGPRETRTSEALAFEAAWNEEEVALDALIEALTGIKDLRESVQ